MRKTVTACLFSFLALSLTGSSQPPDFNASRAVGQCTACKSNLKNIGTALEMWAADHKGTYPASLQQVTPNYLKVIPTCPAARKDTYSQSYRTDPKKLYQFACAGNNHQSVGQRPNHPAYDGQAGLISEPLPAGLEPAVPRNPQGMLTACMSNEKNIATALEMWSTDHKGRYPTQLTQLVPNYLRVIPTCPAAGKDTYSATLQSTGPKTPDLFTFCCGGAHHQAAGVAPNHPAYTSIQGLQR